MRQHQTATRAQALSFMAEILKIYPSCKLVKYPGCGVARLRGSELEKEIKKKYPDLSNEAFDKELLRA